MRTLLLLAALLFAGSGIAQSQIPPTAPSNNSKAQKSHPAPTIENLSSHAIGTDKNPFVIKSLEAEKTPERTEQERPEREDKSANEGRLVWWTTVLSLATIVLAIIAVGQLCAFALQARRLRQTVEEMKIATRASEVASSATLARQRAFVAFISLKLAIVQDFKTKRVTHWRFAPLWENTGDTPTRGMTSHVSLMAFEGGLPSDWDFPDIWSPSNDRTRVPLGISPHRSIFGSPLQVSIELIDEIVTRKKSLYVWGWEVYSDIFPNTEKHITRFAVQVTVDGNPRNIEQCSTDQPFAAKYNCSDEECANQGYPVSWNARSVIPEAVPPVT